MNFGLYRRLPAVACLLASGLGSGSLAACSAHANAGQVRPARPVVVARGQMPDGKRWQLAAFEQRGQLGLDLEGPSGHSYSGSVGYSANKVYSYHWGEGLGPSGSDWYYGPVLARAMTVRLTAGGHRPLTVKTWPIPHVNGLPRGRVFIVRPPGAPLVNWHVTPFDAAGHKVPFVGF